MRPEGSWLQRAFTGISSSRPRPALPILVGLPDLLRPSSPEKRNKKKDKWKRKRKFCPARARAHRSSNPLASSDADSNSASASLSPPLQSPEPPKACLPVSRAPMRPALYVMVKATPTPSLWPTRRCPPIRVWVGRVGLEFRASTWKLHRWEPMYVCRYLRIVGE